MTIEFKDIPEKTIPNFKGGEKEITTRAYFDGTNRICLSTLRKGASIGYHKHEGSAEIVYVIAGTATVIEDGEKSLVKAGDCHYCANGHSHGVRNDGEEDLVVFNCVVKQ